MAVPRRSRAAVLLLLLLTLLLVSHCVHAAPSTKGATASGKSKSKSSPKASDTKPAAAKKEWNKMTEDEWNAAEQDVLDPEDRCAKCYIFSLRHGVAPAERDRQLLLCSSPVLLRHAIFLRRWKPLEPPKPPDVPFDPKHPEKFMAAQKKVPPSAPPSSRVHLTPSRASPRSCLRT